MEMARHSLKKARTAKTSCGFFLKEEAEKAGAAGRQKARVWFRRSLGMFHSSALSISWRRLATAPGVLPKCFLKAEMKAETEL